MGEGSERTECSMRNRRSESERAEEDVFMTGNAEYSCLSNGKMGNVEKVVFQQQENNGKMLLKSDVSTMKNIVEEMVFQQ